MINPAALWHDGPTLNSYRVTTQQCGKDWQAWNNWTLAPKPPTGMGDSEVEAVTDLFRKLGKETTR